MTVATSPLLKFDDSMVELIDTLGGERRVVNAARVSFDKCVDEEEPMDDRDRRLIRYLLEHNHESPFHHVMLCMRIKMPIFVAREYFRHTIGFARNEVSRRYVDIDVECFVPESLRKRHKNKKQGSCDEPIETNEEYLVKMRNHMLESVRLYDEMVREGIAPEQCRILLPQSMYTTFIETASLSAYMRMLKLRLTDDAQHEIRQYAKRILQIIESKFPDLVNQFYLNATP